MLIWFDKLVLKAETSRLPVFSNYKVKAYVD